ncbi:hypothetical protein [Vallitalea guaymasensis]|uniref:hypothetical protein n=1 Tax=Vallitalea guaymasensis TaxID=1185412 RepID=UPI00272C5A7E|nr:hypothetical protein [Vallitalea guaymasensis]
MKTRKLIYLLIVIVMTISTVISGCKSKPEGKNKIKNQNETEFSTQPKEEEEQKQVKKQNEMQDEIQDETLNGIPEEISSLISISGNQESSAVVINTQGGPMYDFDTTTVKEETEEIKNRDFFIVNVHQKQTKNPELFQDKEISFEKAIEYDKESIQMLAKVIKYYKEQGKKVYVLGMSFGALMAQELISEYGVDIADKYLIIVGRLDMPEVIWKSFSKGGTGYFVDGVKAVANENGIMDDPESDAIPSNSEKNVNKLAAGLGKNRYTEKLDKYDLKNITYISAMEDEAVGKLSEEEINFLKSKNAKIILSEGGHSEVISNEIVNGFKTAFGLE